jgi:putative transcriptional regulator
MKIMLAQNVNRVECFLMDDATYEKITVRHLGTKLPRTAGPVAARQIRIVREKSRLSQAALARYLNLTVGYVSQLERGAPSKAKGRPSPC